MACKSCRQAKERQAPEQPPPHEQWCVGEGEEERCFDIAFDARTYGRRAGLGRPRKQTVEV